MQVRKNYSLIFFVVLAAISLRLLSGALKPLIDFSLNSILTGIYITLSLFCIALVGNTRKFTILIVFMLLIALMGLVYSTHGFGELIQQLNSGLRYLLLPITLYLSRFSIDKFRLQYWFKVFAWFFIFVSYGGIFLGLSREIQGIARVEFPFENPNILGVFFALLAWTALIVGLNLKSSIIDGVLNRQYILIVLASTNLLYFSGSFNAIILIMILWIYFLCSISVAGYWLIITLPLIILASIFFIDYQFIFDRFIQVFLVIDPADLLYGGSSFSWRVRTWMDYLSFVDLSSLLFGHGMGSSRVWFEHWAPGYLVNSNGDIPGTHNDYLMLIFDFGIVGLIVFALLIYKLIRFCVAYRIRALLVALFGVLFYMFFDNLLDSFVLVPFFFYISHVFRWVVNQKIKFY